MISTLLKNKLLLLWKKIFFSKLYFCSILLGNFFVGLFKLWDLWEIFEREQRESLKRIQTIFSVESLEISDEIFEKNLGYILNVSSISRILFEVVTRIFLDLGRSLRAISQLTLIGKVNSTVDFFLKICKPLYPKV